MILEVESSANCEEGIFARFKEAGPARAIGQIRLFDRNPAGEWYWVTGWGNDPGMPVCPAHAQPVEDSGAGLAYLVFGGIYGLRFKSDRDEPWSIDNPEQWGESYLALSSERDLRYL
ncbi:hypothetical protein W02_39580 [Nitrospira sp. KM1]|nr:hypothetical protein W02_39580 [Nitrospira sp. KM1]